MEMIRDVLMADGEWAHGIWRKRGGGSVMRLLASRSDLPSRSRRRVASRVSEHFHLYRVQLSTDMRLSRNGLRSISSLNAAVWNPQRRQCRSLHSLGDLFEDLKTRGLVADVTRYDPALRLLLFLTRSGPRSSSLQLRSL